MLIFRNGHVHVRRAFFCCDLALISPRVAERVTRIAVTAPRRTSLARAGVRCELASLMPKKRAPTPPPPEEERKEPLAAVGKRIAVGSLTSAAATRYVGPIAHAVDAVQLCARPSLSALALALGSLALCVARASPADIAADRAAHRAKTWKGTAANHAVNFVARARTINDQTGLRME